MNELSAPPLTQTPAPAARPPAFFDKPLPAAVILLSFPLVAVPMAAVAWLRPDSLLVWLYLWAFGMTHFALTFSVYLNRGNLRYFASTWRNVAIFLAIPAAILIGFDLLRAFQVSARFPVFALAFWGAVRLFDFAHLNRQSFGVLQLFKGRTKRPYPAWLRRLENVHFLWLTGLLFTTFLCGGATPLRAGGGPLSVGDPVPTLVPDGWLAVAQWVWAVQFGVAGLLSGVCLRWHMRVAGRTPAGRAAMMYVWVQTTGVLCAAVWLPLYLAALAVHYVEYHVLMVPRCFSATLDNTSRLDRGFAWLRARPAAFYAAVFALGALILAGSVAGMGMMGGGPVDLAQPLGYLALIAVFDGVFVCHYFVEMFIWRFRDPHFRATLGPLYLTSSSPLPQGERGDGGSASPWSCSPSSG